MSSLEEEERWVPGLVLGAGISPSSATDSLSVGSISGRGILSGTLGVEVATGTSIRSGNGCNNHHIQYTIVINNT